MRRVQGHRRRFQPHLDEFNREVKEGKPVMRRWMNGSADGDMIRGEYWIVDTDVWYADGTYGDTDHRTHALQYIRYVILMELGWNGESDSLCDGSVFREELIKTIGCYSMPDVLERLQADCAHPEQSIRLLSAAFEYSEPREAVMRELGWKWVKNGWVGTQYLTEDDFSQIAKGIDRILDEEDNEEMLKEEIEIRIASTGRSQYINIDDLLSHRFPAGNTTTTALYAPEPGYGVAQAMDRSQLHLCYAGLGD
jgi:hypothetical protein